MISISKESRKKTSVLNNTQNEATILYRKGRLVHKQKWRSNNKARVKQYIQDVHNQNQEAKMTNLGVK